MGIEVRYVTLWLDRNTVPFESCQAPLCKKVWGGVFDESLVHAAVRSLPWRSRVPTGHRRIKQCRARVSVSGASCVGERVGVCCNNLPATAIQFKFDLRLLEKDLFARQRHRRLPVLWNHCPVDTHNGGEWARQSNAIARPMEVEF